jgi:hypothetical protein
MTTELAHEWESFRAAENKLAASQYGGQWVVFSGGKPRYFGSNSAISRRWGERRLDSNKFFIVAKIKPAAPAPIQPETQTAPNSLASLSSARMAKLALSLRLGKRPGLLGIALRSDKDGFYIDVSVVDKDSEWAKSIPTSIADVPVTVLELPTIDDSPSLEEKLQKEFEDSFEQLSSKEESDCAISEVGVEALTAVLELKTTTSIREAIRDIVSNVTESCHECDWQGCRTCRGRGWILRDSPTADVVAMFNR